MGIGVEVSDGLNNSFCCAVDGGQVGTIDGTVGGLKESDVG